MRQIKPPKLTRPQFKRPQMKRPQLKRPQMKGPDVKVPGFVSDIYRDLRDRHLLLPAVALLIALVAVPILLSKSSEPVAPADAIVSSGGHSSSELTAAVVGDDTVSVRNYRKRLAKLKSKNPFKPVFALPKKTSNDATSTSGSTDSTSTDGASPTAPSSSTGTTPATTGTPTDTTVPADTTGAPPSDTGGTTDGQSGGNGGHHGQNQPSNQDVEVVDHLVTRRVDLTIGLQGDPKLLENVKPMTILPDAQTPVVAYLGTDEKGKRAAFVVARDATMVDGTGACVPSPEDCLYITLQKGETSTLSFGPDGQTYELRLLAIRDVELKSE